MMRAPQADWTTHDFVHMRALRPMWYQHRVDGTTMAISGR
jgi:hypothetical protein